jgi:hypothetical protein
MKYIEWKEQLEADGYTQTRPPRNPNSFMDGAEIDRETVEDDPNYNKCQQCGGLLKYEPWTQPGSYRALAVCQNPKCTETFEF